MELRLSEGNGPSMVVHDRLGFEQLMTMVLHTFCQV